MVHMVMAWLTLGMLGNFVCFFAVSWVFLLQNYLLQNKIRVRLAQVLKTIFH